MIEDKKLNPFPEGFSYSVISIPISKFIKAIEKIEEKEVDINKFVVVDKKPIKSKKELKKFLKKISFE